MFCHTLLIPKTKLCIIYHIVSASSAQAAQVSLGTALLSLQADQDWYVQGSLCAV